MVFPGVAVASLCPVSPTMGRDMCAVLPTYQAQGYTRLAIFSVFQNNVSNLGFATSRLMVCETI